jgi:anti-sigma factor NepR-like protein
VYSIWTPPIEAVAPQDQICETRGWTRAMGDERLSANKRTESEGSARSRRSRKPNMPDKNARKQRSGDLGRALRSIYDDTLREAVPDDFLDLIGKLR